MSIESEEKGTPHDPFEFSADLCQTLVGILAAPEGRHVQSTDEALEFLAQRVCREAKAAGAGMDEMLHALTAVVRSVPRHSRSVVNQIALEQRVISACVSICY
jgi:hypothetical protein